MPADSVVPSAGSMISSDPTAPPGRYGSTGSASAVRRVTWAMSLSANAFGGSTKVRVSISSR